MLMFNLLSVPRLSYLYIQDISEFNRSEVRNKKTKWVSNVY